MRQKNSPKNIESIKNIGIISWSIIGILIVAGFFFYFIYLIRIAIIPLIIAIVIAYLLSPLVLLLQKKIKIIFAVLIVYFIFLGIIFVAFFFLIPVVIDQFDIFIKKIPIYIINLTNLINEFLDTSILINNIKNITGVEITPIDSRTITNYLLERLRIEEIDIFQRVTIYTRNIINIILNFIIAPILGFFILKDMEKIRTIIIKISPPKTKIHLSKIIDMMSIVAGKYIRARILISIIVGIISVIALLVLRIDFAILLGFIAGFSNLIPFIGPIIGAIPAVLIALLFSPLKALIVAIIYIIVQLIDNYVLFPMVMKYQIDIHPALTIFSIIAGGAIFGIWGMLLAVPIVAIIQELLRYYLLDRRKITS